MGQFDTPPPSDIENPELMTKIVIFLGFASKTLSGEFVFANAYDSLKMLLLEAGQTGVDISTVKTQIEEALTQLPGAEMENIFKKAEGYLASGDMSLAKSWYSELTLKIEYWEGQGIKIPELEQRAEELRLKVGMEKE